MDAIAEPTRQLVRLRGRSYVAFVFSPVVPVIEWLADIDWSPKVRVSVDVDPYSFL